MMNNNIRYTNEELTQVKTIELQILKEIHDCCQQLGISFFIAYVSK